MDSEFNEVWIEYAAKIKAANERFADSRQRYFVDLVEEDIGDYPAIVLTLERYLLITLSGVFNEAEENEDGRIPVIRFLWFVSPEFDPDPSKAFKFIQKNHKVDPEKYLPLIQKYIAKAFDLSTGKKATSHAIAETGSSNDWVSTVIDQIAYNYHWSEKDILSMSIPRIFLYLEKIKQRSSGKIINSCKEADDLKHEFMQRVNNRIHRN